MQQLPNISRLTTAQARAVPAPAPPTPNLGISSALKHMSSTHIMAFKILGVTISPLHCKKEEFKEFNWEKGIINAKIPK